MTAGCPRLRTAFGQTGALRSEIAQEPTPKLGRNFLERGIYSREPVQELRYSVAGSVGPRDDLREQHREHIACARGVADGAQRLAVRRPGGARSWDGRCGEASST